MPSSSGTRTTLEQLFPFQSAKNVRTERNHKKRRQRESRSEKNEDRGISEGVFDDDERRAPEQAAERER
jgi:hypothetical protein